MGAEEINIVGIFNILFGHLRRTHETRRMKILKLCNKRRRLLKLYLQKMFLQQRNIAVLLTMLTSDTMSPEVIETIKYKRIWTKNRADPLSRDVVIKAYTDADWLENFRISKQTFHILCKKLENELKPKDVFLQSRTPLSVETQIAIAIYKLANCAEYRVIGDVFGVHKSTVKKCIYRVVMAINKVLVPTIISMPDELEAKYIAQQFQIKCHIPQIMGCIDSTHIPISAPRNGYQDFVNQKGWPSYNVQVVVDHNGRIRNVSAKYPGSIHDARVFKDSLIYREWHRLTPQVYKNINGCEIPFMIVGDPAYPLLPWMLKEYPGTVSPIHKSFNVHLNSARDTVEMAFVRLKARWRVLSKRMDISHTFVPKVIVACCALHNLAEEHNDTFVVQWLDKDLDGETYAQPISVENRSKDSISGSNIRNALSACLCENFPLCQSNLR